MKKNKLSLEGWLNKSVRNLISKKDKNILIFSTSVFIILFLNLFSPFGINNPDGNVLFILIQSFYGVQAGIILYIFEFWIKKYLPVLNRNTVRVDQLFSWYVFVTFIISIANYSYYSLLKNLARNNQFQFPDKTLPFFVWTTFLVAFVIGLGLILYFKSIYKRKEIVHVKNIIATKSFSGELIQFWSENKKESFAVDLADLLFLEKKDNYVVVYYEDATSLQKKLIRTSLKHIEDNFVKAPLYRCHVSYIVNLQRVLDYSGNSKGLKLLLSDATQPVPVSSKYYEKIITEMNNITMSKPITA
ncbi:MAG TPA: LytTR family transcriptional regulator DNA-binding domain-containing protein [Segetibacter sp.]